MFGRQARGRARWVCLSPLRPSTTLITALALDPACVRLVGQASGGPVRNTSLSGRVGATAAASPKGVVVGEALRLRGGSGPLSRAIGPVSMRACAALTH